MVKPLKAPRAPSAAARAQHTAAPAPAKVAGKVQLPPLDVDVVNTILEALATAPMAMMRTQPVFNLVQTTANEQLQPLQPAAPAGEGAAP